ncbi:MAG: hypothetical protein AB1422_05915 [bacterium]
MKGLDKFDRSSLHILPISERQSDLSIKDFSNKVEIPYHHSDLNILAGKIVKAYEDKRQTILMMGAHVIRSGVSRYIIELMDKGVITHIAMNGAGPIHEYELVRFGWTTESVAYYIKKGQFGLWKEIGELNEVINTAYKKGIGFGEAVGRFLEESNWPHKDISILAAGYRLKIPVTVHVGIGYDILHEHPNCDGAAIGATSYKDFLRFAMSVQELEKGVVMCFGTAVMGPEVFLKALSMARNIAHQRGEKISSFTTAVFDLIDIEGDYHKEPSNSSPMYYYRPWKSLLVRTVSEEGQSFYFKGDHRATIPALYHLIMEGIAPQKEKTYE